LAFTFNKTSMPKLLTTLLLSLFGYRGTLFMREMGHFKLTFGG
jgi:hypothetical protein